MQPNVSWSKAIGLATVLSCLVIGFAARGRATSGNAQILPALPAQASSQFAIADFDGDNRPDLATVEAGQSSSPNTRYWIAFQLSSGSRQTLDITAPSGGLHLASRDVNGDSFLDVVVTTAWVNRPVAILLNDGHGKFTQSDPSAFPTAFQRCETNWSSTTIEIKDTAAVLATRCLAGDCEQGDRFSLPQHATGLLFPWAYRNSHFPALSAFFGRAPPSFIFHV